MLHQRPRMPVVLDQSPVRFSPMQPAALSLPAYPRFEWASPHPSERPDFEAVRRYLKT